MPMELKLHHAIVVPSLQLFHGVVHVNKFSLTIKP
jgi:hypothetical protein